MAFYKCQKGKQVSSVLNENSWETIQEVGAEGTGANYWSIGDTKTITLNGTVGNLALSNQDVKVFIIEFNYRGDNGIYFQGFKSTDATPVDIALCDAKYNVQVINGSKVFNMNHWGGSSSPYNTNYGGWKGCDLRYDILGSTNQAPSGYGSTPTTSRAGYDATSSAKTSPVSNTLMAALPSALRNVLAAWTIYTDNKGDSSNVEANVTTSVDYLPLLAEYEVFGYRTFANEYENTNNKQKQMAYYANGNSKIKYKHSDKSTAVIWYVRSAYYNNDNSFCTVTEYNNRSSSKSLVSRGLAPAFRVA